MTTGFQESQRRLQAFKRCQEAFIPAPEEICQKTCAVLSYHEVAALIQKVTQEAQAIVAEQAGLGFDQLRREVSVRLPELDVASGPLALERQLTDELCQAFGGLADRRLAQALIGLYQKTTNPQSFRERLLALAPTYRGQDFRVLIIGAGPCGLLLGRLLHHLGVSIELHEKRGLRGDGQQELLQAQSRGPNVSFIGLRQLLERWLPQDELLSLERQFIAHGMVTDPASGKLRSSIGCLQEVLAASLKAASAEVYFGSSVGPESLHRRGDVDLIACAGGIRSHRFFACNDLVPFHFPGYEGVIKTYLTMQAEEQRACGFYREEWEQGEFLGEQRVAWRRKNENVAPSAVFASEIKRFLYNLQQRSVSPAKLAQVEALHRCEKVVHTFIFGNDAPSFYRDLSLDAPALDIDVPISLWMLHRSISRCFSSPLMMLGDATGSTNPLAAIGAYQAILNVDTFVRLCVVRRCLKALGMGGESPLIALVERHAEVTNFYARLMTLLQASLCTFYSQRQF